MFKIVYSTGCKTIASSIASLIGECETYDMSAVISDPESLGDFRELGIISEKAGKGVGPEVPVFIREVLGNYDLQGLEYMFSLCVGEGNPEHSLKIVEKLCSKVGCTPSYSSMVSPEAGSGSLEGLVRSIKAGDIQLAKGSIGTMFYMKANKIR